MSKLPKKHETCRFLGFSPTFDRSRPFFLSLGGVQHRKIVPRTRPWTLPSSDLPTGPDFDQFRPFSTPYGPPHVPSQHVQKHPKSAIFTNFDRSRPFFTNFDRSRPFFISGRGSAPKNCSQNPPANTPELRFAHRARFRPISPLLDPLWPSPCT